MITMNNESLDVEYISQQFCNLDDETVELLLDELVQELDIGDLVEEVLLEQFLSKTPNYVVFFVKITQWS